MNIQEASSIPSHIDNDTHPIMGLMLIRRLTTSDKPLSLYIKKSVLPPTLHHQPVNIDLS